MNNELKNTRTSATGLKVMVIYDKLYSGIKAKDFCDRFAKQLSLAGELRLSFWSLSALQLPQLAPGAEKEANHADLLLMAVNGDELPSAFLKSWVSRCVREMRTHGGAVVAQLHGILRMNLELSAAYKCLKHIVEDSGTDFFSEVVEPDRATLDEELESIDKRAHMHSPVLDAMPRLS